MHRAQVGRWEGGRVDITHGLVRRYETVLGLPEGQLLTAIDLFARSRNPVRPAATLPPPGAPDVDATLTLLESALADDRMTGLDWDRLSDSLGRMPHAMVRAADWERLLRRGIEEVSLDLHLDYAQRAEALARLAGHPRSGPVVASLAEEVVARPDAQFYNDTLSLLQFTSDPQALSVMFGQLREPDQRQLAAGLPHRPDDARQGRPARPRRAPRGGPARRAAPARPGPALPRAPRRRQPRAHARAGEPPRSPPS